MKPYYETELGKLYHGDCFEIIPQLTEKVDLVLADPPYNVGINYGKSCDDNKEDFIGWINPRFKLFRQFSRTVLIVGQARLADYAIIEPWKWLLMWWKPAAMGRSPVGFCNWEPVAMWGEGTNTGVDVVRAPIIPSNDLIGHPCPKPLGWAIGFIELFPQHKTVLDPFIGSGTTAVACERLGRRWIGIEISKEYCDIAVKRIERERSQTKLFAP